MSSETKTLDVIFDASWGSSGKGKMAPTIADLGWYTGYSSSNYPNAGHTFVRQNRKVVVKALPSAAALDSSVPVYLTPGSGFSLKRIFVEWLLCRKPRIICHERAQVVTARHKELESKNAGARSIASTMQGSGIAIAEKIARSIEGSASLVGSMSKGSIAAELANDMNFMDESECQQLLAEFSNAACVFPDNMENAIADFCANFIVMDAFEFRNQLRGRDILHEVSQGWALSIDHGTRYPFVTSRNCGVGAAIDQLGVSPRALREVICNVRTFPIRVGNFYERVLDQDSTVDVLVGSSGPWSQNSLETSWEKIAAECGMPKEEADTLTSRERTTVTKRVRRVCTLDYEQIRDACLSNGATAMCLNFVQYLDYNDYKLTAFDMLSSKTRMMIDRLEEMCNVPVKYIGTGPDHSDIIVVD